MPERFNVKKLKFWITESGISRKTVIDLFCTYFYPTYSEGCVDIAFTHDVWLGGWWWEKRSCWGCVSESETRTPQDVGS